MLELHEYQKRAIQFVLEQQRVYLAIDMGLGKTAIALKAIEQVQQPALVMGPLRTLLSTWPKEIQKWTPYLTHYIMHGPNKSLQEGMKYDIILLNYEGLPWLSKQAGRWIKRLVVYDEGSMIKSHSTSRFKLLQKMDMFWTNIRMILSATPAPNSLGDLWSQYYLLDQGKALGENITRFREKYCRSFSYPGMSVTLYKFDPKFSKEVYDLIAPKTFRLDAKDYIELPDISYNYLECELPTKLRKKYNEFVKEFILEFEDFDVEVNNTAQLGLKLRMFIQGGMYDENRNWIHIHSIKLMRLKELIETSAGQPILCAIQFRGELKELQKAFGDVPVIAGRTPAHVSAEYINKWNEGEIPLMLCHPASLAHGVNLQSGGHILVYYGLPWSLEHYKQLNGRLYRQGQKDKVVIHHITMKDTIDEKVVQALADKDVNQEKFLSYLRTYVHMNL